MSEVKRAGQQMQKATSGSTYTNKASNSKAPRSKPYDRPLNRLNAFKRRPFLGQFGRATTQTKANNNFQKSQ